MQNCSCYDFDFVDHSVKPSKKAIEWYSKNQAKNLNSIMNGEYLSSDSEEENDKFPICIRCKMWSKNVDSGKKRCIKCEDLLNLGRHICHSEKQDSIQKDKKLTVDFISHK
uniref:Uncharacterized protein n=1 Tax=viral metagenome TaxID=1070528 RepID=A0A6C0BCP2_9ZZZZ